jgi:hypothetical protein
MTVPRYNGEEFKPSTSTRAVAVTHIDLNSEREPIREFFLALPVDPDGSLIELNGRAVARVTPVNGRDPQMAQPTIVNGTAEPGSESLMAEPTLEYTWSKARQKIRVAARAYSEQTHADY